MPDNTTNKINSDEPICYHCGNECLDNTVKNEEKKFCCNGCKSVYLLLEDSGLCDYYNSEKTPGLEISEIPASRFNYLDDDKIINQLSDFQNDSKLTITLDIPQIHCYSCLWLLEMLNKIHPGVSRSKVDYFKKQLSVTIIKSETSVKELVIKLASLGYEPRISLNKKTKKNSNKELLTKIGVSAFCFGNIMFMYFPEYLTSTESIDPKIYQYFGYISLFLATILIAIAAKDYFTSAIRSIKHKKINLDVPIALGIATIYLSSAIDIIFLNGLGYLDSLSGLIFFLLLGKLFQNKTFEQFDFERDYKSYFPLSILKIDDSGEETAVPVNDLEIGNRILIRNEEVIPTDGILQSKNASIDYSFVTGESFPEAKTKGEFIYAGGKVKGKAIELIISNTTSQSYLTQLWDHSSKKSTTRISTLSDKTGKWFTYTVLSIAIIAASYWFTQDIGLGIKVFSSVLIIACPCALALAIPITYGNALRILGRKNFYLKNTSLIEKLAQIDHIVFDKTGTLTENEKSNINTSTSLTKEHKELISSVLSNSIHPLSQQVVHYLKSSKNHEISNYEETPGKGISGQVNKTLINAGSYKWVTGKEKHKSQATVSEVHISINNEYKGCFEIQNTYRTGLKPLFNSLKNTCSLEILSGDNDNERTRLENMFGLKKLHFFQTPFLKKEHISEVRKKGKTVMMVGDGLNDAGALEMADIGVAITENTVGFTPASDVILQAKDLKNIDKFLRFSKSSIIVVYACFGLSFLYNFVGLFFAVQGQLSPVVSAILMPISSVSVLLLSLGLLKVMETRIFNRKS